MHPALEEFKKFCETKGFQFDPNDELEWVSLSIGFFAALGVEPEEAVELARLARYTYHYWS